MIQWNKDLKVVQSSVLPWNWLLLAPCPLGHVVFTGTWDADAGWVETTITHIETAYCKAAALTPTHFARIPWALRPGKKQSAGSGEVWIGLLGSEGPKQYTVSFGVVDRDGSWVVWPTIKHDGTRWVGDGKWSIHTTWEFSPMAKIPAPSEMPVAMLQSQLRKELQEQDMLLGRQGK